MSVILPRRTCTSYRNGYAYRRNCSTAWSSWARWLVMGLILFFGFLALVFILCCVRRRRRSRQRYATNPTPMAPQNNYPPPQQPSPQQGGYYAPGPYAPPGQAPPNYGDPNNNGYYPPQQGGVTQPPGAYQPPKW